MTPPPDPTQLDALIILATDARHAPADELRQRLQALADAVEQTLDAIEPLPALTPTEHAALRAIADCTRLLHRSPSLAELAKLTGVRSRSTALQVVRRLDAHRLLQPRPRAQARALALTSAGRRACR